jgi:hypothetical protein
MNNEGFTASACHRLALSWTISLDGLKRRVVWCLASRAGFWFCSAVALIWRSLLHEHAGSSAYRADTQRWVYFLG